MSAQVPRRDEFDQGSGPTVRAGDRDGFCRLLRIHEKWIYKAAWSLTQDSKSAEQVAEDAVLMAWRGVQQCVGNVSIRQILAEQLIPAARLVQTKVDLKSPDYSPQYLGPWHPISETSARSAAFRDQLHSALCALPYDCREAFVLRDVLSFTPAECAAILHIEMDLTKRLIANARLQIRDELAVAAESHMSVNSTGGGQ